MYRITKVLNHNTVIGLCDDTRQEYLIMGKGIGFGKKVSERIEVLRGIRSTPYRKPQNGAMPENLLIP